MGFRYGPAGGFRQQLVGKRRVYLKNIPSTEPWPWQVKGPAPLSVTEDLVSRTDDRWLTAMLDGDMDELARILAPDYKGVSNKEVTYAREILDDPEVFRLPHSLGVDATSDVQFLHSKAVYVFGSVAVVVHEYEKYERGYHPGASGPDAIFHYTNTYAKRDNEWKLLLSRISVVQP